MERIYPDEETITKGQLQQACQHHHFRSLSFRSSEFLCEDIDRKKERWRRILRRRCHFPLYCDNWLKENTGRYHCAYSCDSPIDAIPLLKKVLCHLLMTGLKNNRYFSGAFCSQIPLCDIFDAGAVPEGHAGGSSLTKNTWQQPRINSLTKLCKGIR